LREMAHFSHQRPIFSMPNTDYKPISCSFHDILEHHAMRGDVVRVVWEASGVQREGSFWLLDVSAHDGADWVKMLPVGEEASAKPFEVRLDRLVQIDGQELPRFC
jgi:transcriptional antiterminator Rof (Rho-off)